MLKCLVKKELRFGSGKVALDKGAIVRVEEGRTMYFVWHETKQELLYSFQNFKQANQHLAEIKD